MKKVAPNNIEMMEISFNIIYLVFIWFFVVKMYTMKSNVLKEEKKVANKFLLGFFLLALGDTGHVGFRVVAYYTGGLEENALLVGLGALSTAVTITFLYMLILEGWRIIFEKPKDKLYYLLIACGIVRLIIMAFPQNQWGNVVPPYGWSLARNIPLTIQGLGVGYLLYRDGKEKENKVARNLAVCIFISYAFYLPVILAVRFVPMLGMLMIPKTIAYMLMAVIVYKNYFKK